MFFTRTLTLWASHTPWNRWTRRWTQLKDSLIVGIRNVFVLCMCCFRRCLCSCIYLFVRFRFWLALTWFWTERAREVWRVWRLRRSRACLCLLCFDGFVTSCHISVRRRSITCAVCFCLRCSICACFPFVFFAQTSQCVVDSVLHFCCCEFRCKP